MSKRWIPLRIVSANPTRQTSWPLQPNFNSTKNSFTLAQYDVSFLAGNPSVGFRLRFKSDVYVTAAGMAVDDFEITGPSNGPLPVELISFTGDALESFNRLKWETLSEINNAGFEIERSTDGSIFKKVGFVKGNGNTSSSSEYLFDDYNIQFKNYYYRLKQIDFDGASDHSNIILIKRPELLQTGVDVVFPNPFTDELLVLYKYRLNEPVMAVLFDITGKQVFSKLIEPSGIQLTIELSNKNITQGTYFLKLSSDSQNSVHKVFKR